MHPPKPQATPSRASTFLRMIASVCALQMLSTRPAAGAEPGLVASEFIVPDARTPQVHASTLVETTAGDLLAAWFAGTHEGHGDVGIWLSKHSADGWSAPVEVATGGDGPARHPTWNPVLFQPSNGPLLLFYKVGPSPQKWWGMLKTSADGGKTWSAARRLPEGFLGPIKNKPLQLETGELLCPTSFESDTHPSRWSIYFERTPDLGATWERTPLLHDGIEIRAIQPSLLVTGPGRLLALGRTRNGRIFQTLSTDSGRSWGQPTLGTLPNPNSGTDAVTLRSGSHVLVYNHTEKGRSPLNVASSTDGFTWLAAFQLESGPGEFSYPAVIQTRDGRVHVTYTWKRAKIRHAVLDASAFELRPVVDGRWPH